MLYYPAFAGAPFGERLKAALRRWTSGPEVEGFAGRKETPSAAQGQTEHTAKATRWSANRHERA